MSHQTAVSPGWSLLVGGQYEQHTGELAVDVHLVLQRPDIERLRLLYSALTAAVAGRAYNLNGNFLWLAFLSGMEVLRLVDVSKRPRAHLLYDVVPPVPQDLHRCQLSLEAAPQVLTVFSRSDRTLGRGLCIGFGVVASGIECRA